MILIPEGNKTYIDKSEYPLAERDYFRKAYGEKCIYYCSCNMKIPYKLSKDNRFYPCKHGLKHEANCTESEEYKKSSQRFSAYKENEDDFSVKINIKDDVEEYLLLNRKCKKEVKYLSFENFIEIIFLSSYFSMKRSTKFDKKDIYKFAYAKMCSSTVNYKGKSFKIKSDESPFKLFYGRMTGLPEKEEKIEIGGNVINCYSLSINDRNILVKEEDLSKAVKHFKEKYNCLKVPPSTLCVIKRDKSKYHIENAYFSNTKIYFFPFSNKGCICSSNEKEIIDEIEKIEEGQLQWYFYRPFEYGYGAYGDKYLEDGIIISRGKKQKICLDFSNDKTKNSSFINDNKYALIHYKDKENINRKSLIEKIKALH